MKFIYGLSEIDQVAQEIANLAADCRILLFRGPIGAGKTTLIKKILKVWGVEDLIVSPTYSYVIEYRNRQGQKIYHFDLYRIKSVSDFVSAGFIDFLHEQGSRSIIEWPEVIEPILQDFKNICEVSIDYDGIDSRVIGIKNKEGSD